MKGIRVNVAAMETNMVRIATTLVFVINNNNDKKRCLF